MRPAFLLQEGIAIGGRVPDGERRSAGGGGGSGGGWRCVVAFRFSQAADRDGGAVISSM
jgi:hypothetical protein